MKILGRTLVILAVALVVVGLTFAVARSSSATGPNTGFSGDFAQGQTGGTTGSVTAPQGNGGFRGGAERDRGGAAGLFGLLEVGKSLIIIAVIIAIVAPIFHFVTRRKQRAVVEQQGAPPDSTLSV